MTSAVCVGVLRVWGRGGAAIFHNKPRLSCIKKPMVDRGKPRRLKKDDVAVPMDRQSTRPKTGPNETKRGSVGKGRMRPSESYMERSRQKTPKKRTKKAQERHHRLAIHTFLLLIYTSLLSPSLPPSPLSPPPPPNISATSSSISFPRRSRAFCTASSLRRANTAAATSFSAFPPVSGSDETPGVDDRPRVPPPAAAPAPFPPSLARLAAGGPNDGDNDDDANDIGDDDDDGSGATGGGRGRRLPSSLPPPAPAPPSLPRACCARSSSALQRAQSRTFTSSVLAWPASR